MSRVVILSRTSQWGLEQDAKLIEQVFREAQALKWLPVRSIDHMDPYQFTNPKPVDIQIHLEVPCRQAWMWAKINILVINAELWINKAWDWALQSADFVVFKSPAAAALFPEVEAKRSIVIPWRTITSTQSSPKESKFLYLIGGSKTKLEAAKIILRSWKSKWCPLEIWGTSEVISILRPYVTDASNILLNSDYKTTDDRLKAQKLAKFHCVASTAEGYGYTFAECAAVGSLPLWVGLPVQDFSWRSSLRDVGRIPFLAHQHRPSEVSDSRFREDRVHITVDAVQKAVESLLSLSDSEYQTIAASLQKRVGECAQDFRQGWKKLVSGFGPLLQKREQPFVPKRLAAATLPKIAIVTLTHNRPKWFTNMTRNILLADYPSSLLTWVIVDDSDGMGRIDDQVMKFREKAPSIRLEYVSLTKKLSVGEKRNRGCRAAPSDTEIFVMMDDDDHYPKSSIEARVAYLKEMKKGCVYCATLPMYDCKRFISAMNVPPMDLSPSERVSEATLAFTRAFWEARPFTDCSVAEGEAFLAGRESDTMEIAPDGVIVSFLHGKNSTSRRVPASQEPNGCHYGFDDDYFMYLTERGEEA